MGRLPKEVCERTKHCAIKLNEVFYAGIEDVCFSLFVQGMKEMAERTDLVLWRGG